MSVRPERLMITGPSFLEKADLKGFFSGSLKAAPKMKGIAPQEARAVITLRLLDPCSEVPNPSPQSRNPPPEGPRPS